MEDRVFKIQSFLESIQPRLQQVVRPQGTSFKNTVSKVLASSSTTAASAGLPENRLAETMTKNGQRLGADSVFGQALVDYGGALDLAAEAKISMEESVEKEVVDPLQKLEKVELKQVMQHVKTRDTRRQELQQQQQRLQKKIQKNPSTAAAAEDEVRLAGEKLEEACGLARSSVVNFLDTEEEQIMLLKRFVEAQLQLHSKSVQILKDLDAQLQIRKREAEEKPRNLHRVKRVFGDYDDDYDDDDSRRSQETGSVNDEEMKQLKSEFSAAEIGGGGGFVHVPLEEEDVDGGSGSGGGGSSEGSGGVCVALYDFVPESEEDLNFRSGDIIEILERIDENWLRGRIRGGGRTGQFPRAFVEEK